MYFQEFLEEFAIGLANQLAEEAELMKSQLQFVGSKELLTTIKMM